MGMQKDQDFATSVPRSSIHLDGASPLVTVYYHGVLPR
jgi:hypothetical protein